MRCGDDAGPCWLRRTVLRTGPYNGSIEEKTDEYTLIDINANTIAAFMRGAQKAARSSTPSPLPAEVRLMGSDVINISITDSAPERTALFAPLSTGDTQLKVRIDNTRKISLPYVGQQFVMGMTPMQVKSVIRRQVKDVTSDAQAHVDLAGDLTGSLLVASAVKTPGRFSTLQGPLTLLDAINQASGPAIESRLVSVTVRNGTQIRTLNYEEALTGNNSVLKLNSEVILERARQRFVATGAVGVPSLHDMPQQYTSLLDALGSVGGLKEDTANTEGAFLCRIGDDSRTKPIVLRINMRNPAATFYACQVMIKPDDTIYITNSTALRSTENSTTYSSVHGAGPHTRC